MNTQFEGMNVISNESGMWLCMHLRNMGCMNN